MKPGPGLFTKKYSKDGEFYVYGSPETKAEADKREREDRARRRQAGNPNAPATSATAPYNPPPAYNQPPTNSQPYAAATTFQPLAPPAGNYSVHFASYASAELAQRGWSRIWNRHAQMLAGIQPHIDYGSLGGGQSSYHLFGKGLSKQRADTICRSLRSRNESCSVVAF